MNTQQETQEAAAGTRTSENAIPKTPGEWLRRAREKADLTVQQVAGSLRLDVRLIAAIEDNRFKELGAPVYAKGYIRKYARMVGVAEEDMLRRYEAFGDIAVLPDPIPTASGSIPQPPKLLPSWALWAVAAMILIAIAITLLQLRSSAAVMVAPTSTALPSPESTPVEQPAEVAPVSDMSAQEASQSQSVAVSAVAATSGDASAMSSTIGAAQLALLLKFSGGDSWVEVYDANNHQVLYDLGRNASARQISGVPPLRVVLGSASNVSAQVNGRKLNIPASRIEANVARFAINANGAIE